MPYLIEIVCIGKDNYALADKIVQKFMSVQDEFEFRLPPGRLKSELFKYNFTKYETQDVYEYVTEYLAVAKSPRLVIGLVDAKLNNAPRKQSGIFGSFKKDVAIVSLENKTYAPTETKYLAYYLLRYAISFINSEIKNHEDTRGCFFDSKNKKDDLKESLQSLDLCDDCKKDLAEKLSQESQNTIEALRKVVAEDNYEPIKSNTETEIPFMAEENENQPTQSEPPPLSEKPTPWVKIGITVLFLAVAIVLLVYAVTNTSDLMFNSTYYVVLVCLGVAAGLGVFFGSTSYAEVRGDVYGWKVRAGGSAAISVMVVLGGFFFQPPSEFNLKFTLRPNPKIENIKSYINNFHVVFSNNEIRPYTSFNDQGIVYFENLPGRLRKDSFQCIIESPMLELERPDRFYYKTSVKEIPLRLKKSEYTIYVRHGSEMIPDAKVFSKELHIDTVTNKYGYVTILASPYKLPDFTIKIEHADYARPQPERQFSTAIFTHYVDVVPKGKKKKNK